MYIRRCQRIKKEKSYGLDFATFLADFLLEGNREIMLKEVLAMLHVENDAPKMYDEAITSRDFVFKKKQLMIQWIVF